MNSYEEWRAGEINNVGLVTQLKAEAALEKHRDQPFVEVQETATGTPVKHRRHIAEILQRRKEVEIPRKIFSVPPLPWKK